MRSSPLLAVALLLASTACTALAPPLAAVPTARDTTPDRILVTVATPPAAAALSPSGRLDYRPLDAGRLQLEQTARTLAHRFDMELEEEWPIPVLGVHCFVFRVDDTTQRDHVIARLANEPVVADVQPMHFFQAQSAASAGALADPLAIWNERLDGMLYDVHASTTGRSVGIAVVDAGADLGHEDLQGARITAHDMVEGRQVPAETHGTAVVGLLSARPANGIGIRGYVPDAEITLIRACWEADDNSETAICNSFTLAKALSYALEIDADIVNLSIAGPRDPLLERLAQEMIRRGQVVVAAGDGEDVFPASLPQALAAYRYIRGSDEAGGSFTLLPGNRYGLRKGSSIAAARLTAAVALIRQLQPALTAGELHAIFAHDGSARTEALAGIVHLLQPAAPTP